MILFGLAYHGASTQHTAGSASCARVLQARLALDYFQTAKLSRASVLVAAPGLLRPKDIP